MCACRCGIRVTLRDGEVRYIDGNPDHPLPPTSNAFECEAGQNRERQEHKYAEAGWDSEAGYTWDEITALRAEEVL